MDEDFDVAGDQTEHSSFSPDTRCYHFASQNLFLSQPGPSHFGLAGGDNRIYLAYEQQSKLEIFKYGKVEVVNSNNSTPEESSPITSSANDVHSIQKEQFTLERTVLLHDAIDIGQVVYSSLAPESFVLLANGGNLVRSPSNSNQQQQRYCMRSLKVYTNFMATPETMTSVKLRGSGELLATLGPTLSGSQVNSFNSPSEHLHSLHTALNLVDLKHADISTLAHYVAACPVTGNLLISTANGTTLLYSRILVEVPTDEKGQSSFSTVDYLLSKSITILDSWTPEVVKLSLNYVAFMCPTHFSLIQIVLDEAEYQQQSSAKDHRQSGHRHHRLEVKCGEPNQLASQINGNHQPHLIYNRLFDEPAPAEVSLFGPLQSSRASSAGGAASDHADIVWGPVGHGLGCKFALFDYRTHHQDLHGKTLTSAATYKLLFCRHFRLPARMSAVRAAPRTKGTKEVGGGGAVHQAPKAVPSELRRIAAKNNLVVGDQSSSSSYLLYGFELLPLRSREGTVFAHALYLLSASQQFDCYLIDLRRDRLRLVPISHLTFGPSNNQQQQPLSTASKLVKTFPSMSSLASTATSISTLKANHTIAAASVTSTSRIVDFSANPQEDLVHILLDSGYLDSYATQLFPFLVSNQSENLYCSRPLASMYRISGNLFLNVIAVLSSPRFVYLLSGVAAAAAEHSSSSSELAGKQQQQQHTIYYLERPSIDHLQADILSALDDLKSSSDELALVGVAGGRVHGRHSFHRLYSRVLAIIKFALHYPMRSVAENSSEGSDEDEQHRGQKLEEAAANQCLQALCEKVEAEIAEIIAEGASCTDPNCPFASR